MKKLGVQSTVSSLTTEVSEASEGFSIPTYHKKQLKKKLTDLLSTSKPMTEEEAERVVDLCSPNLTMEKRMSLYKFWLQRYHVSCRKVFPSASPRLL